MQTIPFTNTGTEETYMLRLPEVQRRCGLSCAHIYRLIKLGQFLRQIPIGKKAVAWNSRDIDNSIQQIIRMT